MKKVLVLSVGGSIIIPDKINYKFLSDLKKALRKHYRTHKFVLVCGGGSIARKYISALRKEGKSFKELSMAGIRATRTNASFVMQFFGKEANDVLPLNMKDVKDNLAKNKIVICGALRYVPRSTSDSTAAKLANLLKTDFINLTDVSGLYTANPKKYKSAKLIEKISWKNFEKMALEIKREAGQHFVLDQEASIIIRKHKIKTFLIGPSLKNFSKLIEGKKFIGTTISN